jgi:hypothetical protein
MPKLQKYAGQPGKNEGDTFQKKNGTPPYDFYEQFTAPAIIKAALLFCSGKTLNNVFEALASMRTQVAPPQDRTTYGIKRPDEQGEKDDFGTSILPDDARWPGEFNLFQYFFSTLTKTKKGNA